MPNLLISDFDVGFENDKEPFLLPERAFPTLENAFCWRGKIKRKFGFDLFTGGQLNSRLRILIGTTGASPFAGTIPGVVPIPSPGRQIFSIGSVILTSNNSGGGPQNLISTDPAYSGTINNTTGAYSITHPAIAATSVYYYPGLPVMGLRTRENEVVNYEDTIGFDPQFSYRYDGTSWDIFGPLPPAAGSATWTIPVASVYNNFFYTTNYRAAQSADMNFYVINGVRNDNIKYFTQGGVNWTNLRPLLNSAGPNYLDSAKIILPFKDRLLVLNTLETHGVNQLTFINRARWSQNGDPTQAGSLGPYVAGSWADDTIGKGGYVDAPTSEAITSAQFVQNRLIVFFERSTWELIYTGNEILPFTWQQINTELGCESTFSEVAFDDGIVGVGNRGIHLANPNSVQRIDQKIPDLTGQINNVNQGPDRVYGIRDFNLQIVMWTFPTPTKSNTVGSIYPNKNLIYNYINNSFATFDNSFTCFGYLQENDGLEWQDVEKSWEEITWPWNYGLTQAQYPLIVAGNQQGWTFLNRNGIVNDPSLMVTDVTNATLTITVPDHNLRGGEYIRLSSMGGLTFNVDGTPVTNTYVYQVQKDTYTQNDFIIETDGIITITGTYTGGGQVQILNNFNVKTKNFALFDDENKNTFLNDMHLLLSKTTSGEFTLNLYQDFNFGITIDPLTGDSTVRTRPEDDDNLSTSADKIWHEVKRGLLASSFQLEFTLSDTQMRDTDIQASNFELHAILLDVEPTGRLK